MSPDTGVVALILGVDFIVFVYLWRKWISQG